MPLTSPPVQPTSPPPATQPPAASLSGRVRTAVDAAVAALLAKQRTQPWGKRTGKGAHWCGELEGDSILSSEYLLMKFILNQENPDDEPAAWPRLKRIANQLRLSQRPDGTWGQYPGAPMDLSATVKAYFCLKLFGDNPHMAHMTRARERILAAGGAECINTFSMFYLACLGQVSWEACPAIPPQIVMLPRWFPFHLAKVAAWTRTMILPLAICSATQPIRKIPTDLGIDELFVDRSAKTRLNKRRDAEPFTWNNFFLWVDSVLKWCRRIGFTPYRKQSLKQAEEWILHRMDPATTEGLGAIFPPMVYVQVAFQSLDPVKYTRDHPVIKQAEADLDAFMIDEPNSDPDLDHIRLQPCFSAVWDTAIALDALTEAGLTSANNSQVAAACDWLLDREIKRAGDCFENFRPEDRNLRPGIDMACWAFEYRNDWYPDVDDTCMVAKALYKAGDSQKGAPSASSGSAIPTSDTPRNRSSEGARSASSEVARAQEGADDGPNRETAKRAVRFILAMQNDDGGWAAFDRTRDRPWMEAIPFADHNAMQDPSCSDITGRVSEAIISAGLPHDHPAIRRGTEYLLRTQQPEGCWWGRWGVNYIYGTWQAINGLSASYSPSLREGAGGRAERSRPITENQTIPTNVRAAAIRARDWFLSIQNPDGGFGESANSYLDRKLMGKGPSTASQTAWAAMTLMNLVPIDHPAITRAIEWLLADQLIEDKRPFKEAITRGNDHLQEGAPSASSGNDLANRDPIPDLAGGWNEHWFTGTGFPKVFYLRYHLYRHNFPLKALARWSRLTTRD